VEGERDLPETVHIILFCPGTPEQTVHTIESPPKSGINLILAFENGGDCVTFARVLQDLEFENPCPEETMFEPFSKYCEMSGLSLMIVPKGFELTPPQINTNDYNDKDDAVEDDSAIVIQKDNVSNGELDAWG